MTSRIRGAGKLAHQAAYWREHGQPERAEAIEAHLTAVGRCRCCGTILSDPVSVERGVGPTCWAKRLAADAAEVEP